MRRSPAIALLPPVMVCALAAFCVALLVPIAAARQFWFDELLTTRLSRLDSIARLWQALASGFEFNPPLYYWVTALARTLPGPELLTARVPPLTGYVLLTLSLFAFLRRRIGPWFALSAVAFLPLAPYTTAFAVEARAYMLLLGVSAVALLAWQRAGDERSVGAATGLAIAVALALLLHVWAVLLLAALAAGELVVAIRDRIRAHVVAALAAGSVVLLLYPPLLSASQTFVLGGPVYEPTLDKLYLSFRNDVPRPRVVFAVALVSIVVGWWESKRRVDAAAVAGGLRVEEIGVLVALLLSPLVPFAYASVAGGAFITRYGMYALPAMAALGGAAICALARGGRVGGVSAAIVALGGVILYLPPRLTVPHVPLPVLETLESAQLDPVVSIVLVNPVEVLPFDEQAPPALLRRAVFVADPDLAVRHTGANAMDLTYLRGAPYLSLRIRNVPYRALAGQRRLYLAGKWQALSWVPQQLQADGWRLTPIGGSVQAPLFEAVAPEPPARGSR